MDDVDDTIKSTLAGMRFAAAYNHRTGANLTHWDMEQLGLLEEARLFAAFELWDV